MQIYAFLMAGVASWFHPEQFSPVLHTTTPFVCAMNPPVQIGTRIVIENENNGKSSHCIITGSGPCCGRIVDVSPRVATELGFGGLTKVRVYKIVGQIKPCPNKVEPLTCKSPPPLPCEIDLPKPSLLKCD